MNDSLESKILKVVSWIFLPEKETSRRSAVFTLDHMVDVTEIMLKEM